MPGVINMSHSKKSNWLIEDVKLASTRVNQWVERDRGSSRQFSNWASDSQSVKVSNTTKLSNN